MAVASLARAFVAVFPPEDVVHALDRRIARLRDGEPRLRWSRAEQWHFTLRFLGPVTDVGRLVDALGRAVSTVPAIEGVRVAGGGAFPTPRRGSVLWVGVEDGAARDALSLLASAVEDASVAAGFAPGDRPFHPHLTVARAGRARDLRAAVAAIGDAPVGVAWSVRDVVLMASDTRPDGAVHEEVARLPLGG